MSVVVTLHVFSGRPDPSWELSQGQIQELSERLGRIDKATLLKPPGIVGGLGYRGFSVRAVREIALEPDMYIHAGIIDRTRFDANLQTNSPDFELWLLATSGPLLSPDVEAYVRQELSGENFLSNLSPERLLLVPPYNPGKWNNDPTIQNRNNCYNYANDRITNTFAQPGRGSGRSWTQLVSCATDVAPAAQRDGQLHVGPPSTTPSEGHFIALVLALGYDYHWYRLDANGMWSHKPGTTPARNTDNSGRPISDPRNCDRGPYSIFCGFYHCVPSNIRIG